MSSSSAHAGAVTTTTKTLLAVVALAAELLGAHRQCNLGPRHWLQASLRLLLSSFRWENLGLGFHSLSKSWCPVKLNSFYEVPCIIAALFGLREFLFPKSWCPAKLEVPSVLLLHICNEIANPVQLHGLIYIFSVFMRMHDKFDPVDGIVALAGPDAAATVM